MAAHHVTLAALADALGLHPVYLGQIRRGERRPNDLLKVRLEAATLQIEAERQIDPRCRLGVPVSAWYEDAEMERLRKGPTS